MKSSFILAVCMCLSGNLGRMTYEWLKGKGRVDTGNKAVLSALVISMSLFLGSWTFMCSYDPLCIYRSSAAVVVGNVVSFAGLGLAIGGLMSLKRIENVDHLVTTGLFSRIRHPMYSGFILWIVGWIVGYGALLSGALAAISVSAVLHWRGLEERALESRYGEAYSRYRERTWF